MGLNKSLISIWSSQRYLSILLYEHAYGSEEIHLTSHTVNSSPANPGNVSVKTDVFTRIHNRQSLNVTLTQTLLLKSPLITCNELTFGRAHRCPYRIQRFISVLIHESFVSDRTSSHSILISASCSSPRDLYY